MTAQARVRQLVSPGKRPMVMRYVALADADLVTRHAVASRADRLTGARRR